MSDDARPAHLRARAPLGVLRYAARAAQGLQRGEGQRHRRRGRADPGRARTTKVRRILTERRARARSVARRLLEKEVMDGDELRGCWPTRRSRSAPRAKPAAERAAGPFCHAQSLLEGGPLCNAGGFNRRSSDDGGASNRQRQHKELFCRSFIETHVRSSPRTSCFRRSTPTVGRVWPSLPIWDEAVNTERETAAKVRADGGCRA